MHMYLENTLSYFKRTFKPSGTIEGTLSLTNFRIIMATVLHRIIVRTIFKENMWLQVMRKFNRFQKTNKIVMNLFS